MVDPVPADPPLDVSISELLAALRAVAEPTRLRLLVLCSRGELIVEKGQYVGRAGRGQYLRRTARGGAWS